MTANGVLRIEHALGLIRPAMLSGLRRGISRLMGIFAAHAIHHAVVSVYFCLESIPNHRDIC